MAPNHKKKNCEVINLDQDFEGEIKFYCQRGKKECSLCLCKCLSKDAEEERQSEIYIQISTLHMLFEKY